MPVFDLDYDAIERDEVDATIRRAVTAYRWRLEMPTSTPLQRTIADLTPRAYCDAKLALMRARVRH